MIAFGACVAWICAGLVILLGGLVGLALLYDWLRWRISCARTDLQRERDVWLERAERELDARLSEQVRNNRLEAEIRRQADVIRALRRDV